MSRIYFFCLLALITLLPPFPLALIAEDITFTAEVDNQKIGLDDTLALTVTISGANLNESINPIMPDLNDFDIVGQSQSSNISFINGKVSSSRSIIYSLTPKRAGKFTIPPVRLNYAGKEYRTSPVDIEVVAGSMGTASKQQQSPWSPFFNPFENEHPTGRRYGPESIQLVGELDRKQVYQGQQAMMTLKILTQVSIAGIQIDDFPVLTGFWVEDLQVDKNPSGKRVNINGQEYVEFLIKRNALFPTHPGRFTIGPATLAIQTESGGGVFSGPQSIKRQSKALVLDVLPLPQGNRPANFDGIIGSYSISAQLDRSTVALGDVAALTITISGRGNLKTIAAPTLPPLDDFKIYEPKYTEKISLTGAFMEGEKSWEYVLSPKVKGTNQIGSISLPFFDPARREYRIAQTRTLTLKVEGGQLVTTPVTGDDRSQLRALRQDISFIHTNESEGIRPASAQSFLAYLWIILPPLVNVVAFAYRRHRESRQTDLASYLRNRAYSQFKKSIKKARTLVNPTDAKLFYHLLTDSLARYAAHKLSLSAQGLTLQSVLDQLEERRIEPELQQRFQSLWNDAEYGLFGAGQPGVSSMEKLMREANQTIGRLDGKI